MPREDVKLAAGSPERFGYEWALYSEILPESKIELQRWLGSTGIASFEGKKVLDVGCGMGRNPYWMIQAGASSVVATDVDERSLNAATRNLSQFSNVTVQRYSVYDFDPTVLGKFDRVTCIGVLHHLQEPREALQRMWDCVATGGDLVLWCYGKQGNELFLPFIQIARFIGSRLPLTVVHGMAKLLTLILWPLFRFAPWKTEYYRNLKSLSFKNVESTIFDQMIPRIAHYWGRKEIEELVSPLGGDIHIELVQGNSWHVRIVK